MATQISLRKANAIQQSITEMVRAINFETITSINEFEDVDTKLNTSVIKCMASVGAAADLYEALYSIRLLVSDANATSGINGLLTRIAHMEKLINLNTQISTSGPQGDLAVIKGKIAKIKGAPDAAQAGISVYSRSVTEVTTGVFTPEQLLEFKMAANAIKKEKTKLQDKVLELNIGTTIELPDNVVAILESADLI